MQKPRVAIFNDTHGWHSAQLTAAFARLGIETVYSDLAFCRIDLSLPQRLYIPGFNVRLPDAVLVRGIAPGSL
ncbi:MAG: RimK family alpha-L-glutamate ligase, partial [Arsukibacterium sp.]|nr:RimK family alpha-L-glutamate ligase [Arsukibacterium sp.]